MKFTHTPHRFYQFAYPTHAPYFDLPDRRWPTIVGQFIAPLVRHPAVKGFVFLDHYPKDFELRIAAKHYRSFEKHLANCATRLGIHPHPHTTTPGQTIGRHAYHGQRWLADQRKPDWHAAQRRSELVFRFLHAGCELFIHSLVPDGHRWQIEINNEAKENPLKNVFESLCHQVANFSKAEFEVLLPTNAAGQHELTTVWMTQPTPIAPTAYGFQGGRCHL